MPAPDQPDRKPADASAGINAACDARVGPLGRALGICRIALYPNHYAWYILASSLDIMMTYLIIWGLGGREVNAIAQKFIDALGHWGLILLKFSTVLLVIVICEVVGRRKFASGRRLAIAAICISALPVGAAILQFMAWTHLGWVEVPHLDQPHSTRPQ
jgi:hypothetical protein